MSVTLQRLVIIKHGSTQQIIKYAYPEIYADFASAWQAGKVHKQNYRASRGLGHPQPKFNALTREIEDVYPNYTTDRGDFMIYHD